MLKKIIIGVLCIIMVFPLVGCDIFKNDPDFALDRVTVYIKAEFEQEFDGQQFTIENFTWDNIDRISYQYWYTEMSIPNGWITVYLTEHGEEQVLDAIEHFETLDFVDNAKTNVIYHME